MERWVKASVVLLAECQPGRRVEDEPAWPLWSLALVTTREGEAQYLAR